MSDEPTKLKSKSSIAYKCTACGKVDQRHRMKTHTYKEHVERGNVTYLCSLCSLFGDTYASLAKHLVHEVHSNNISLYGGDSNNTNTFVHCAGEEAECLQEGNHYAALSQEKSEEIWRRRTPRSGGDIFGAGTSGGPQPSGGVSNSSRLEDQDVGPLWSSALAGGVSHGDHYCARSFGHHCHRTHKPKPCPSRTFLGSRCRTGVSTWSPSCDAASSASSHSIECSQSPPRG